MARILKVRFRNNLIEYTLFPLCVKAQGLSLQKKYILMSSDRNEWELTHLESYPDLLL